jgi:N-methylhydantoinase B
MQRRELRPDSGGAGTWRGGLGQLTEFARRGDGKWSVSSIADRTTYAAPGLQGGRAGALGEVAMGGKKLHAKALQDLRATDVVCVNLPGGGGYGDPFERAPERILSDVIDGYVTAEQAQKTYGVAVKYRGKAEDLVKLPGDWFVDQKRTEELRKGK